MAKPGPKKGKKRAKRFFNIPLFRSFFGAKYANFTVGGAIKDANGNLDTGFNRLGERVQVTVDPGNQRFKDFTLPVIGSQIVGALADHFGLNPKWEIKSKGKRIRIKIL